MRIAFIGQQEFGKAVLEAFIARGDTIAGVFCIPDKPGTKPDALKSPDAQTAPTRPLSRAGLNTVPASVCSGCPALVVCALSSQLIDPRAVSRPPPRLKRYEPERSRPLIRCRSAFTYWS